MLYQASLRGRTTCLMRGLHCRSRLLADHSATNLHEELAERLFYGWGNDGWSAKPAYFSACYRYARQAGGPVLECGSGLSTIVLAAALRGLGGSSLVTLERDNQWRTRVTSMLGRFGLDNARVLYAPLRAFRGYDWYEVESQSVPSGIELVIRDGPPGDTKSGRPGLLPRLGDKLAPTCRIFMDDFQRPEDRSVAMRWLGMRVGRLESGIEGAVGTYAVIRLGHPDESACGDARLRADS